MHMRTAIFGSALSLVLHFIFIRCISSNIPRTHRTVPIHLCIQFTGCAPHVARGTGRRSREEHAGRPGVRGGTC
jgi:hypothetical protein